VGLHKNHTASQRRTKKESAIDVQKRVRKPFHENITNQRKRNTTGNGTDLVPGRAIQIGEKKEPGGRRRKPTLNLTSPCKALFGKILADMNGKSSVQRDDSVFLNPKGQEKQPGGVRKTQEGEDPRRKL